MTDRERSTGLQGQLQQALLGTAVKFCAACRRLEQRRQRRGFDLRCSRLLDEVVLSRSLLLLLAEEVTSDASAHGLRGRRRTL
jgi:hypothetical protein